MKNKVQSYTLINPDFKTDDLSLNQLIKSTIQDATSLALEVGMKYFDMKVDLIETSSKSLKELESIHGELRSDASSLKDRNLDYLQVIIEGEVDSIKCFECGYIFGIKNASPSCVKKKMCIQCLQKHYN